MSRCIGDIKKVLVPFGGTPGMISSNFYASAHCGPTLILQVSSKSVQVWGVVTEKPFRDAQSEFNIGFFEI